MKKPFNKRLLFTAILLAINLTAITAIGQSKTEPRPPKCSERAIRGLDFYPKAFTLTEMNVRLQIPEYSFLRGRWILGQFVDTLPPNTCLAIIEKKEIGVIQIWYLVKYLKDGGLKSGWVWGGTKDVDDTKYIGGDKTPERDGGEPPGRKERKNGFLEKPPEMRSSILFTNIANAQADSPPGDRASQEVGTSLAAPGVRDERPVEYRVEIPLLGWSVNGGVLSAVLLFLAMVIGMFAKAFWDQTESGSILPSFVRILRPLLISPIAFSAFWTPMYIQQGGTGVSLTMALYAFQIGFMWQHVLEKKVSGGVTVAKENP